LPQSGAQNHRTTFFPARDDASNASPPTVLAEKSSSFVAVVGAAGVL
jgi:hypothetical protein